MRQLITSALLAVLLADQAASILPARRHNDHHPPHGVRRMIETLQNGRRSPYQCNLERLNLAGVVVYQ